MSGRAGPVEAPAAKQRSSRPRKSRVRRRAEQIPEPREVLAAPGRPLDPGVRRALEERLGQDFSQVRIHADAEAAGLTELLGADAVAVGSDVFFAAGAYRPETAAGLRLLAHELIHTVQVPDGGSRLRVGRETALQNGFGAVSDPLEAVERAAEAAADTVAGPDADPAGPSGPAGVEPGPTAASWLRYASVTAEQRRTELLDPATLMDRLVSGVLRTLRGDPADASGRARMQLARMAPELRADVLQRIQLRLPSTEYADLVARVEQSDDSYDAGAAAPGQAPEPVWSGVEELERQREMLPEFGQDPDAQSDTDQKNPDQKNPDQKDDDQKEQKDENQKNENQKDADQKDKDQKDKDQKDKDQKDQQDEADGKDERDAEDKREPGDDKTDRDHAQVDGQPAPAATAVPPGATGPAPPASTPAPVAASPDTATGGGSGVEPVSAAPVEQELTGDQSPLVRHGVLARRGQTEVSTPDELPLGLEPGATDEIALPDVEPAAEVASAPAPDLLPSTDLDVSNVPTADDELALSASGSPPSPKPVPSFPAPPKLSTDAEAYLADEAAGPAAQAARERASDAEDQRAASEFDQPLASESEPAPEPVQDPVAPAADEAPSASGGFQPMSYTSSSTGTGFQTADLSPTDLSTGDLGTADVDTGPQSFDQGDSPGFDQGPDAGEPLTGPGALPQDASLEPGGGECGGGPVSEPAETGAAACGAGGAPAAAEPVEPETAAPDVSAEEPESGLSTVEQLPPDQMQTTLVSVNSAVTTTVGQQRTDLAAAPPQMDRPAGAPQTLNGPPTVSAPGKYPGDKVEKIRAAHPGQTPEVEGAQAPTGENPADQVDTPGLLDVGRAILGAIVGSIAGKVQKALGILPTKDPGLQAATVGRAGKVPLKDDTDPNLADQQKDRVQLTGHHLRQAGQQDAAQPMGENQVYPTVPPEVLQADVSAGAPTGPGGPAAAGATGGRTKVTGLIAAQERGPDIQAGFVQGRSQMGTERRTQQTSAQQAQTDHEQAVATEIAAGTDEQATVRAGTLTEVGQARQSWNEEQAGHLKTLEGKSGESAAKARTDIKGHQEKADADVDRKTTEENTKIVTQRNDAEQEAGRQKEDGKKDSGNWLSRAWDSIKDAFNKVKNAIKSAFDKARKAVTTIVDNFKKAAFAIIDTARNLIIAAINTVADTLIAIGDVALAAFPEARDKWRGYINGKRDAAVKKVNEAADKLKENVAKALDAFGKLLTSYLDLLEKGLLAAVSLVEAAVNAAMKFAESLIALVGQWADLIVDIAANPGGWLSNLGTAAKEGVQHHLWGALKTAVKQWFNDKVESVLGLGKLLWNVLIKGCLSVSEIGKMAWQAVLSALPMMIIALVIEKLVSLIVPAAGAIMTIIQGLIAAWGSISRIIAAFSTFFAFLKSVKTGGVTAACLFAQSVAAGAVVLLDFIANFLLVRLGKALKSVANKLKGLAQKVMKGLKRGGKSKKRADGGSVNRARNDMKRAGAGSKRDIEAGAVPRNRRGRPGRHRGGDRTPGSHRNPLSRARKAVSSATRRARDTARRLGDRFRRSRVGRALSNGPRRLKNWYGKQKQRYQDRRRRAHNRDQDQKARQQAAHDARLAKAVARMRPRLQSMMRRGVRPTILRAALAAMRLWYRLSGVAAQGGKSFSINAWASPLVLVIKGEQVSFSEREILQFVEQLAARVNREMARRRRPLGAEADEDSEFEVGETIGAGTMVDRLTQHDRAGRWPAPTQEPREVNGRQKMVTIPGVVKMSWGELKARMKAFSDRNVHLESQQTYQKTHYEELANEEAKTGHLLALGVDLLRIFQGRPTQLASTDLQVLRGRFIAALTTFNEGRRDPTARVYAALLAQRVAQASSVGDAAAIVAAIRNFPMGAVGAQGASVSKRAWVAGEEFDDQRTRVLDHAAGQRAKIKEDLAAGRMTREQAREQRKVVTRERATGLAQINGWKETPSRKAGISGEGLMERELAYVEAYLKSCDLDFVAGFESPAVRKRAILDLLRRHVMETFWFKMRGSAP